MDRAVMPQLHSTELLFEVVSFVCVLTQLSKPGQNQTAGYFIFLTATLVSIKAEESCS